MSDRISAAVLVQFDLEGSGALCAAAGSELPGAEDAELLTEPTDERVALIRWLAPGIGERSGLLGHSAHAPEVSKFWFLVAHGHPSVLWAL